MKSKNLTKFAIALLAMAAGVSAYGQGSVANLTLKLTEYLTDPALILKDEEGKVDPGKFPTFENEYTVESSSKSVYTGEYGSKITTYKISNKEFLEALVDEGVISDIKGWAVVAVEYESDYSTFITKNGENPINVSQYLYSVWKDAVAEQASYKYVSTYNYSNDTESSNETGSFKEKSLVGVKSQFSFLTIDLQGVYDGSESLKSFGKGEDQYTQWIPGARSVTSISGSLIYDDEEDDGEPSLITGSISIAAGKQADLSLYPDALID